MLLFYYIPYLWQQKICQCYLLGYSKVDKTLYVHSRTIFVRIRTEINIPKLTLLDGFNIHIIEKVSLL